jgi:Tol biopolymer transport system component
VNGDGALVAFAAATEGIARVYLHDRAIAATTEVTPEANGPSGGACLSISGDGEVIAFDSLADNLISDDTNRSRDVFTYARSSGALGRASIRTSGTQLPGDSGASGVSISSNGNFVVFGSKAEGVVAGDSNGREDVFRRDLAASKTTIASVNVFGEAANNSSYSPSIDADGSIVAFTSMAANLASGDSNRQPDIFLRDSDFPETAGSVVGPEETGPPPEDELPIAGTGEDSGPSDLLVYGAIAGGVLFLLVAGSLFLGRRGRA